MALLGWREAHAEFDPAAVEVIAAKRPTVEMLVAAEKNSFEIFSTQIHRRP